MSTMRHVEEDLAFADRSRPGLLSPDELALVARVRDLYRELSPIPCTSCRYCMPCPQGVAIPEVLGLYNDTHMYQNLERAQFVYRVFWSENERADQCTACGECVDKCPQGIADPRVAREGAGVPHFLLTVGRAPRDAASRPLLCARAFR